MAGNLRQARLQAGGRQKFMQYACCPKCHSIYPKEQCVLKDRKGNVSSATCSFIRFPTHPQLSRRMPCKYTTDETTPYLFWEYNSMSVPGILLQEPY